MSDESLAYSYICPGEKHRIVVFIEGEKGHIFTRQVSQALRFIPAEASYQGEDVSYTPNRSPGEAAGQTAEISMYGKRLLDCQNDAAAAVWENAKLRGVSYRAIGQEPSWVLEIDREKGFLLITEYGSRRDRFPYVQPASNVASKTTQFDTQREGESLMITIFGQACHDSMSGEVFSSRVKINWRESVLSGCGRALH